MSSLKLKDRIESYQQQSDHKLLNKLPVIIVVNGRSFSKTTSILDKPYYDKFSECLLSTCIKLCSEVEGVVFSYCYNDEIVLISKNDQTNETSAWFDNKIQKISSITASIATSHFNNYAKSIDLEIIGEALFSCKVFTVPNIIEATNTIIFKQQNNFYLSVDMACFYELIKIHDKSTVKSMLLGLSLEEKIDLLRYECNVEFNNYSNIFRRGASCYKVPVVLGESVKNKWFINTDLPIFSKDHEFITNIIKNGTDIFRS